MTEPTPGAQGSCLCGAVRYRIDFPTRFFAHCHCRSCRRAHGAPVVSWAGVTAPAFHLLAGEDTLRRYESSPRTFRSFCGRCGTSLFFTSERWEGEVHVAVATLDEPMDRPPMGHHLYEEHVDWFQVGDPPSEG